MVRPLTVAVSVPKVALRPFANLFALTLTTDFSKAQGRCSVTLSCSATSC